MPKLDKTSLYKFFCIVWEQKSWGHFCMFWGDFYMVPPKIPVDDTFFSRKIESQNEISSVRLIKINNISLDQFFPGEMDLIVKYIPLFDINI